MDDWLETLRRFVQMTGHPDLALAAVSGMTAYLTIAFARSMVRALGF